MQIRSELPQFHKAIHAQLQSRLEILYPDSYFAKEIFNRIAKGRKMRSLLFSKTAKSLDRNLNGDTMADVCLTIEMPHAASVLVDDILDGDDTRHGYVSSNIILGTPIAALEAHYLCAEALKISSHYPHLLAVLVNAYCKTAMGELYDVFAVEPLESWICKGYCETVFQKTSSAFEYAMVAAAMVTDRHDLRPVLKSIGRAIGKLYQLSNDYYDLQVENLRKRHSQTDVWRITYSFPLALYLERFGTKGLLPKIRKKMLSYDEWRFLLHDIWTPEIKSQAWRAVQASHDEVVRLTSDAPLAAPAKDIIQAVAEWILQEDFWYHSVEHRNNGREEAREDSYTVAY
jgi:geranylgeranyl pyrophosphate synthase